MAKLIWDQTGERAFENGVDHGVLYPMNADGTYGAGVVWNGLTSVSESPEGGDANDLWADNIKYATLRGTEDINLTIEAYTYPDKFAECDGSAEPVTGMKLAQQKRMGFGLCYRTNIGNDQNSEAGYKLHLVYGCTCSPSEKSYETINDSPDAITFSWEVSTTPVPVEGYKPTALITIDSRKFPPTTENGVTVPNANLKALEDTLYGTDTSGSTEGTTPALPTPARVIELLT